MSKHRSHKKQHHQKSSTKSSLRIEELATEERRKQNGGVITEVIDRDATGKVHIERHRAKNECILDYYLRTHRINLAQHEAGTKLSELFARALHGTDSTALNDVFSFDGLGGHAQEKMADFVEAMEQLRVILPKLSSPQKRVLRNVCGYNECAGTYANRLTLARGLEKLARHWHLY